MSLRIQDEANQGVLEPVRQYTADKFEQIIMQVGYDDRLLALIHGKIVEKMPTEEHRVVAGNIFAPLHKFVAPKRLGRVGIEVRHRPPKDPDNSRLPDISFSSVRRPLVTKGSVPTMPDLAVEVQSPNDSIKGLRGKAAYYLAHGSQLVWLIYPSKRIVEVFYADGEVDIFGEGDVLRGEAVLPGFPLPVADIFDDPLGT